MDLVVAINANASIFAPLHEPSDNGTQIPEPGTLALFGVGLAGLGFARRRKAAARNQR